MARNLEHLELPHWQEPLPRRKHGGPSTPPDTNRKSHGQELTKQVEKISDDLRQRKQLLPSFINPKLIFKLKLKGTIQEEALGKMGLNLLSQDANRIIVVFPDEASLSELKSRLESFTLERMKYDEFLVIEKLEPLAAEDRIGRRLKENPLKEDEIVPLDIELWHAGSREECHLKINEIKSYLASLKLNVTDEWIGERLCLMRAKINSEAFRQIIEIDYVKEVDRRPTPTFEMGNLLLDLSDIQVTSAERDVSGLTGVLIIDSGVMQQHPLIKPVLGDAQVFPDRLNDKITGGAEDGDQRTGGHGTAVAGIAIYNHIGGCIERKIFEPHTQLFSARVTDENNNYDEDELLEHQLDAAVEYFLKNYPTVKVINISLGNDGSVYSQGMYQFRFAAAIDELAYKHRDKEIIFVCSSGNFFPQGLSDEEIKEQYPNYLLTDDKSRIIDPATSAIALTVGGLSYGSGRSRSTAYEKDVFLLVADEVDFPSPFTCTGFGVDGAIKPDLVDYAGDWRFERGRIIRGEPQYAGIPTIAKNFAPPNGRLFRTVAGTSFAAPRVANLAARLFNEFPSASSNLIRAMIADSARIPKTRPALFDGKEFWDKEILSVYGYGQSDFERARWSDESEVLLLTDGVSGVDSFQIFTIPSLPPEFLSAEGNGFISVTLAFDPPTRHTRGDSYLGITMSCNLFRNAKPEGIADVIREWSKEEKEEQGILKPPTKKSSFKSSNEIPLHPKKTLLAKGTLQKGTARISGNTRWEYDGGPLCLAVICQRKWAPVNIERQRFAIVVSIAHENPEVQLYAHLQQYAQVTNRVRARV